MTKQQANSYLWKCYKILDQDDLVIHLRKIQGVAGIAYGDGSMLLNPHESILSTVIHECLHFIYPKFHEKRINELEVAICDHLSKRQWRNLMYRIANRI